MKFVHIGFPKTGTTFLQTQVFSRLKNFCFFDRSMAAPFLTPLKDYDDTVFDATMFERLLASVEQPGQDLLVSDESLTGLHHEVAFVNRSMIARRLRDAGFKRVIISIRNQFDVLESAYKQHVRSGGVLKFDDYVTFEPGRKQYIYPEYFEYESVYRLYSSLFGKDNLLVLQSERLRQPEYAESLFSFLSAEAMPLDFARCINRSLSYRKTQLLRLINFLTCNSFRPDHLVSRRISTAFAQRILAGLPIMNEPRSFLSARKRSQIEAFYGPGNSALARLAGIELAPEYP
jgi:hypothetical protein